MKKTLILCPEYPLPENNGANMRTMNFVRFFSGLGKIDIAFNYSQNEINEGNSIFNNVFLLKSLDSSLNYKYRFLQGFISRIPAPIILPDPSSQLSLLRLIEKKNYDYIVVRYTKIASYLLKISPKFRSRIIMDFDDILSESLYDAKHNAVRGRIKQFALALNRILLTRYEKRCLTFGASIFCSEKDKELIIHGDRQDDVFVVPNIYENISFEKINFSNNFDEKNIFLFIGALNYGPNVRGITWFIDNILPKIKERHPDSKLFVVGRNPKKSVIKKCRKMDCVQLFPDALDISEFYKKCRVVVVPLLEGSGTRIKILESALAERPILSTPKGAEGLSLIDNQDLLLFNNAEEFCLKYEKLSNKDDYDDLASNAKKAVKRLYSSKSFATKMRQIMVSIDEKN